MVSVQRDLKVENDWAPGEWQLEATVAGGCEMVAHGLSAPCLGLQKTMRAKCEMAVDAADGVASEAVAGTTRVAAAADVALVAIAGTTRVAAAAGVALVAIAGTTRVAAAAAAVAFEVAAPLRY